MTSSDYSGGSSGLTSLLPDFLYGSDFDSNAADFKVVGEETKNGVDCIHYSDTTNLGVGGAALGVGSDLHGRPLGRQDRQLPRQRLLRPHSASAGETIRQLELLVRDHPRERRGRQRDHCADQRDGHAVLIAVPTNRRGPGRWSGPLSMPGEWWR